MSASAEIICVGTELLLGDILDTNSQYLSRKLAEMGIDVHYRSTVGDNAARLSEVFKTAYSRSDVIILTGGLGPTEDDITVKAVCECLDIPLILDDEALRRMKAYFERNCRKFTDNNISHAMVPSGGTVFQNEKGTAPGSAVKKDGKTVMFLPGPPNEMTYMFEHSAAEYLKPLCGGVLRSHFVHIFGLGEAQVDSMTKDLQQSDNPTVAPYAKDGECMLRITAKADTADTAERLCGGMIEKISERLGEYIYSVDVDSLQQVVVDMLKEKRLTCATAESCTAGYISKRITEISGASAVFTCGVASYSNEIKHKLLGVDNELFAKYGAVSEPVAVQMARGVRKLSGCDLGLSVTGIAGPESDGTGKPVGLAYIAISDKYGERCIEVQKGGSADREYIRYVCASEALNLLRRYLIECDK